MATLQIPASVVTNGDGFYWHEYDNTPQWLRTTGSADTGPTSQVPESGFEGAQYNATDWYDGGVSSFNGLARFSLVFGTSVLAGKLWTSVKLVMVPSEQTPQAGERSHIVACGGISETVRSRYDGDINYYGSRPMVPGDSAGYIVSGAVNVPATSTVIDESKVPMNTAGNTIIGLVAEADVNNVVVTYQNVTHWYSSGHANEAYHPYLLFEGYGTVGPAVVTGASVVDGALSVLNNGGQRLTDSLLTRSLLKGGLN